MDLKNKLLGFLPAKVWVAYLLGVLGSGIVLAAVYTFGGGPELAQQEGFIIIDRMLFNLAALSSTIPLTGLLFYYTRDVSTSLAPIAGVAFSLYSGAEDVVVYIFCIYSDVGRCADTNGFPGRWEWLDSSTIGHTVSSLGFAGVTDFTIFVSIIVWFILSIILVKTAVSFETRILGVEV